MARLEFKNIPGDAAFHQAINRLKRESGTGHIAFYFDAGNGRSIGTSNIFYVKLKSAADLDLLQEMAAKRNVEIIKQVPYMEQWYALKVKYDTDDTSLDASNYFYETGLFEEVDPGFMFNFSASCATDPMFGSQWGLQNNSNPSTDINVCQAWGLSQGANVKVAVVDHGIEKTHIDLASNISSLSFDSKNGISPSEDRRVNGHGTQVGGIIAAVKNNNEQITGVAPQAKLMSVSNDMYPYRSTIAAELASGISWAWQNGSDVINNSWGDFGGLYQNFHSSILENAIINAMNKGRSGKGTLVIFSSGNLNGAVDYPANFHPNIVAVGASTSAGSRWASSNYGSTLDLVAPGAGILSTSNYDVSIGFYEENSTMVDNGTSFAAPHVAGVIALMLSANPYLTRCQVANILESTAQKVGGYSYTTTGGRPNGTWNSQMGYGLVDAYAAVQAAISTTGAFSVITGTSPVCTSRTFSLNTMPAGSTVSWASAYTNGLTINSSGVATRQNGWHGSIAISATINTNGCTALATRDVWVGAPLITNPKVDGVSYYSPTYICPGSHWITVTPTGAGALNATWTVQSGVPYTVSPNYLDFYMYSNVSSVAITARSSGTCGQGPNTAFYLMKKTWGCPSSFALSVYPNPVSEELTVETIPTLDEEDHPPRVNFAALVNEKGVTLSEGYSTDGPVKINVKGLKKGMYYLHVMVEDQLYKEQILIE